MYIQSVISYKNAWDMISSNHSDELNEIMSALDEYLSAKALASEELRLMSRELWEQSLYHRGWEINERTHYSPDGQSINFGWMGPTKNGLNAQMSFSNPDFLGRWIFQQSTLAIKHGYIKYPILLVPVREFVVRVEERGHLRGNFERYLNQLQVLSPLSHPFPFLIIGYSDDSTPADPFMIEIESDPLVENNTNTIVDRCIEFPAEYHQAGLDILNYFGTYLREQYPEDEATVRIEQSGLIVRMVIETASGRSEIIEKALHEYELIVTRKEIPEKFTDNDKLVLELKSELRIAEFRVQSKQDIIEYQKSNINKLLDIVGNGLANKSQVSIDFKPTISTTNTITINPDVSSSLGVISELKGTLPSASTAYLALQELEGSLAAIEKEASSEIVAKSAAMSKFRRIIDTAFEGGSEFKRLLDGIEGGWEIFKDLSKKYNSLAGWCGLPQVPNELIK